MGLKIHEVNVKTDLKLDHHIISILKISNTILFIFHSFFPHIIHIFTNKLTFPLYSRFIFSQITETIAISYAKARSP